MENKEIQCPNCHNTFWYWTINDHITCQGCKTQIPVEPCEPETLDEEVIEDEPSVD